MIVISVVPPQHVAQLLSLGAGYEGYIQLIGIGADILERSTINKQATYRFRTATKPISLKVYNSGWRGGSAGRITTYKVSAIGQGAKIAGNLFFIVGAVLELNDYAEGRQSFGKMTADIAFSAR